MSCRWSVNTSGAEHVSNGSQAACMWGGAAAQRKRESSASQTAVVDAHTRVEAVCEQNAARFGSASVGSIRLVDLSPLSVFVSLSQVVPNSGTNYVSVHLDRSSVGTIWPKLWVFSWDDGASSTLGQSVTQIAPARSCPAPGKLAYDSVHQILYAACTDLSAFFQINSWSGATSTNTPSIAQPPSTTITDIVLDARQNLYFIAASMSSNASITLQRLQYATGDSPEILTELPNGVNLAAIDGRIFLQLLMYADMYNGSRLLYWDDATRSIQPALLPNVCPGGVGDFAALGGLLYFFCASLTSPALLSVPFHSSLTTPTVVLPANVTCAMQFLAANEVKGHLYASCSDQNAIVDIRLTPVPTVTTIAFPGTAGTTSVGRITLDTVQQILYVRYSSNQADVPPGLWMVDLARGGVRQAPPVCGASAVVEPTFFVVDQVTGALYVACAWPSISSLGSQIVAYNSRFRCNVGSAEQRSRPSRGKRADVCHALPQRIHRGDADVNLAWCALSQIRLGGRHVLGL